MKILFECLVSSASTISESLRIFIALKVISSKLPIGVATKYNVPDMSKKFILFIALGLILTCCTLSSNEFQKEDGLEELDNQNLLLSSSKLRTDLDIIFFEKKDILQKHFLDGIQSSYFFLKENQKRNISLNFIDYSKIENSKCKALKSKTKKIFFLNDELFEILKNCNIKNNNNVLVIYSIKEGFDLDLNFINPFYSYLDYLFSLDNEIILEESIVLTDKILPKINSYLISRNSNIEKEISNLFEINSSSERKRELERITQNRIYQTPRFRKDLKNIIIDTEEVTAERIIPAIRFNLIFEPTVYVLPQQLDFWRFSKKDLSSNVKVLEHPILLNNDFLFDEVFSKKQINEKVFYSLGFDSLMYLGKGLNTKYKGLLGEYTKQGKKVFIQPEKIGF